MVVFMMVAANLQLYHKYTTLFVGEINRHGKTY